MLNNDQMHEYNNFESKEEIETNQRNKLKSSFKLVKLSIS